MNQTKEDKNSGGNQVFDSMKLLHIVLMHKYFIIIFAVLVTTGTSVYWFLHPNYYSSTANLLPPKSSGSAFESMMGNISSTLRSFGLSKIGPKTDGSYSPSVLLESRTLKDEIIKQFNLRSVYRMEKAKYEDLLKAFEENLNIQTELDGNFTITITDEDPKRAAAMSNKYAELANTISEKVFQEESRLNIDYLEKRVSSADSVLTFVGDSLQKFSRIYKIFQPEEQAINVGKAFIELRTEIIKQEIQLELLKNRYGEKDPLTQMQSQVIQELKSKLTAAEEEPGFSGNFTLGTAAKIGIEYMRLYTEYETFTKVKAFLMPMLEEQKINEFRNTVSFIVLDPAVPADKKSGPRRSLYIAGAFLGSTLLGFVFVLFLEGYRDLRRKYKEYLKEL